MVAFLEGVIIGAIVVALLFVCAILGAAMGAFAGWILGFTPLGGWILNFLASAGIHTNMVDLGTTAGFIGGFFGHNASSKSGD